MPTKIFTSGRIKKADWEPSSQQLDIHWDTKAVMVYRHVPHEVFRRLCNAPNPAAYWEDRIAEEYPKGAHLKPDAGADAAEKFRDLFGGEGE